VSRSANTFKVRIDVSLPPETLKRIEHAIQSAVLAELATVDIADGYSVIMRGPADDKSTPVRAEESPGGVLEDIRTPGLWVEPQKF
jgi:hypothetical protein